MCGYKMWIDGIDGLVSLWWCLYSLWWYCVGI